MAQTKSRFHQNKVPLNEGVSTLKEAHKQLRYIRKYKLKPMWKNLSIAKRYDQYVIVGVKK